MEIVYYSAIFPNFTFLHGYKILYYIYGANGSNYVPQGNYYESICKAGDQVLQVQENDTRKCEISSKIPG